MKRIRVSCNKPRHIFFVILRRNTVKEVVNGKNENFDRLRRKRAVEKWRRKCDVKNAVEVDGSKAYFERIEIDMSGQLSSVEVESH